MRHLENPKNDLASTLVEKEIVAVWLERFGEDLRPEFPLEELWEFRSMETIATMGREIGVVLPGQSSKEFLVKALADRVRLGVKELVTGLEQDSRNILTALINLGGMAELEQVAGRVERGLLKSIQVLYHRGLIIAGKSGFPGVVLAVPWELVKPVKNALKVSVKLLSNQDTR